MENIKQKAIELLKEFKQDNYVFGIGVYEQLGEEVARLGKTVSVVGLGNDWTAPLAQRTKVILEEKGVKLAGDFILGVKPNAPREDVFRIVKMLREQKPEVVVSVGGGSTVDATKAAIALYGLEDKFPEIDAYFGAGEVSNMLSQTGRELLPHVSVMMAASSAAHLTKYSNITDVHTGQKMLIVDEAVVPLKAMFDYTLTLTQPYSLTVDGALDGISHSLEVLMGVPESQLEKAMPVCLTGIELIVNNIKKVANDPDDIQAREAIGMGTDLGGYAIMIGGTNGAHLNSFSMTDILSHGRACAMMNPYYVVFFSKAIDKRLLKVAKIFRNAGYIDKNPEILEGRELGEALANGMIRLSKDVGFPTILKAVPGYTEAHKRKCLEAAKNPKLESKLKNMPVPMTASDVDEYMGSVLGAAESGDMEKIKNM